ncbi:Uncharacterized protein TPAR_08134 [Tolypocladium paradoxum]|uniref:Nineteen complex-related protein 2-domain-containing protein n=1 Tax=Tolypocladium paradoxum TaxID=94208 RepID=A0A2S4KNA3_9HYPO|nr:Uncharacterized protein TPAR_08134 [Tolypocladium paradoxum]
MFNAVQRSRTSASFDQVCKMSSFAAKRRARVIKVADEDGAAGKVSSTTENGGAKEELLKPLFGSKSGRKPFRQSGLRKSFNPADEDGLGGGANNAKDDEGDDGPAVARPSVSRSSSLKQKKKPPKSRLSFGGAAGDPENGEADEPITPKRVPLGQRALENRAAKRGMAIRGLPTRSLDDDDDRPKYSKEFLNELQSSTPSTPRDLSTLHTDDADDMELDASELEGALVVDTPAAPSPKASTQILSEAEIRVRKERRARLAQEEGFLAVEDEEEEDRFGRKKDGTRLLHEDEDLGEGFDDYVEDGGLSLGQRAAKERRKRERQQMAELITAAEGHTSDSSSDSDAERRIAYEAAQTRAGLDGLKKAKKDPAGDVSQVPPKITPLPSVTECLARLQSTLKGMEEDIESKNARVEQLRREKEEINKREGEVQALLDETGRKYQEAMGQGRVEGAAINASGPGAELARERGLDSLGTTPRRLDQEDVEMS